MNAVPATAAPRLRPMTLHDVDAVGAIEASAYGFAWTRGNFIDSLAASHLAEVLEDERVIGYFVALPGVDEMHLLNITIAPHRQGQGHGTRLLDAVAAHASVRGLPRLWLEVRASNERAMALYVRRGFVVVGRRRGYYPAAEGREDAILMSRSVAAPSA